MVSQLLSPRMNAPGSETGAAYLIIDQFGIVWEVSAAAARLLNTERTAYPVYGFGERQSLGLGDALHEHICDAFQSEEQTTEIVVLPQVESICLDSRVWTDPVDRRRYLIIFICKLLDFWSEEMEGEARDRVDAVLSRVAVSHPERALESLVRTALRNSRQR